MLSRTFYSQNPVLKFAIEDIFKQFNNSFFMSDYDFVIFAISSHYPYRDIHLSIRKIIDSDNYVAFNATDSFCNADTISNGVVALFIKFENKGAIETYHQNHFEDMDKCYDYLIKNKKDLHIILSTASDKLPKFLDRLSHKIQSSNNKISIIGGVSSGDLSKDEVVTYQYVDNEIVKDGFMIISFKNIEFQNGISLGYKPLGPVYQVNLAKDNRVYVTEYMDASMIANSLMDGMENKNIQNLWYSPIVVLDDRNGMVDVVRTFKYVKEGEYVEFFGPVENDSFIKLSFATDDTLINNDKIEANRIKERINHIELGLNFSCIARQYALGDSQKKETALYSKIFNAAIFGFFTFGEIGMSKDFTSLKFYNQTSLVCGLREI